MPLEIPLLAQWLLHRLFKCDQIAWEYYENSNVFVFVKRIGTVNRMCLSKHCRITGHERVSSAG